MSSTDDVHLLILGSPRSGTTLLAAMLGCHPEIALLNEDTHGASLTILSKRIRGVKLCIPNQIELEQTLWMRCKDFIITAFQISSNPISRYFGRRVPVSRGIKSKYSIRGYQKKADRLYVLGTIRNPYDSIMSIMSRGQQSKRTAEHRWRRVIEIFYELSMDKNEDGMLLVVDFDELVTEPVEIMKKLLPVLGCSFNEVVLEGFKHTPQYRGSATISASKASKGVDYALTYPLLQSDVMLRKKYLHLIEKCI